MIRYLAGLLLLVIAALIPMQPAQAGHPAQPAFARIVSLGPLITENVFLLGAGDYLVGNTMYCVRPEGARGKEKVGSVLELSIEKIVSLHPDLILASNLTPVTAVDQLKRLGYKVETFRQSASFTDLCTQLLRLGEILGLEQRAREIVSQAEKKVEDVASKVRPFPRQKVFLQVGARPLFSSVKGSFTNDFIELAGGINIAGTQKIGAVKTEQVIALDPDLIVIAVMGAEKGLGAEEKKTWETFTSIKAVRNGRVYTVDPDSVCSPSPLTFADTLEMFARLMHPQAFPAGGR